MAHDKETKKSKALVRTRTLERAQGNSVPIEFRTLSIHVTETQRSGRKDHLQEKPQKPSWSWKAKPKDQDLSLQTDFFSTAVFHKLSEAEVNLRLNTNETLGLSQAEAERRLKSNGPNTLTMRKPNYVKKILGYLFGGFCSILWLGAITFLICWRPPLSDPPNITNLALAILVVSSHFRLHGRLHSNGLGVGSWTLT